MVMRMAVNRQQHYLEGGHDWFLSGIVHLLHSSASPSAHRIQPMSSEMLINVCTTSALVKYQEILVHVYAHSAILNRSWDTTEVSGNLLSITTHIYIMSLLQQNTSALA